MFRRHSGAQPRRGAVRKTEPLFKPRQVVGIVAVLALVSVIGALVWQLHDYEPETLLPIEHVAIEGNFKYLATQEMQARVNNVLAGGYFTVNLHAIREALLDMPWVDDVSVRRQWPPALKIRVSEKNAVAYWGDHSLISDSGELFSPQPFIFDEPLPRLEGPELLHKKVWEFSADVSAQLIKLGMRAEKISLDERRAWSVYVARTDTDKQAEKRLIEINFGNTDVAQRVRRFVSVFAMHKVPDLDSVQVIDMSYPNGFALRSKSPGKRDA